MGEYVAASLRSLFEALLDAEARRGFLRAETGEDFENRIKNQLDTAGFNQLQRDEVGLDESAFRELKDQVKDRLRTGSIANPIPARTHHFLAQPFGSQDYPDLIIFDGPTVHSIELKYSKESQAKPMWNSGLPRQLGIYIFGSYKRGDVTFFLGRDIISRDEASAMTQFFDSLGQRQHSFNTSQLANQPYGFTVYVRRAYDQRKSPNPKAITDFFNNPNRSTLEQNTIATVAL